MSVGVLIVDDEALVRAGFKVLVEAVPDLHVVGEAAEGARAVELATELRPEVVLLDLRMPVMDGLEATRRIVQAVPDGSVRVLVVTTFDEDDHVFTALRAGASGFVVKDTPPEQLIEAIRTVAAGDALLSPGVTRRLLAEFSRREAPMSAPAAEARLAPLTEREREVLVQVAEGRSNAELAEALYISPATAKTHVGSLLSKLGARDRAQLVVLAYESGLVRPGGAGR